MSSKKVKIVLATKPKKTKTVKKRQQAKPRARRTVFAPVSISSHTGTSSPRFVRALPSGGTTVRHREFFKNVTGTSTFTILPSIPINPGNEDIFRWLSSIAMSYEFYKFKKLIFEYKPEAPTSCPGKVYLSVDYDVTDTPVATKVDLLSQFGTEGNVPWDKFNMKVDKGSSDIYNRRYTRDSPVPTGIDPRLYNLGNLMIATDNNGTFASAIIGELWVDYEVEFYTPQRPEDERACVEIAVQGASADGVSGQCLPAQGQTSGSQSSTSGFNGQPFVNPNSTVNNPGNNSITINKIGQYALEFYARMASTATPGATIIQQLTTPPSSQIANAVNSVGDSDSFANNTGTNGSTRVTGSYFLDIFAVPATIVFNLSGLAANYAYVRYRLYRGANRPLIAGPLNP